MDVPEAIHIYFTEESTIRTEYLIGVIEVLIEDDTQRLMIELNILEREIHLDRATRGGNKNHEIREVIRDGMTGGRIFCPWLWDFLTFG